MITGRVLAGVSYAADGKRSARMSGVDISGH
jgi:hypothetical protein